MKKQELLTDEQNKIITRLYETDATMLIAKMGAGKTVCTLSAIRELLRDRVLNRVLIVAPLKVCKTVWPHEVKEWAHLTGMRVAVCAGGNADTRRAAVESDSDVLVVNFENLVWLLDNFGAAGCDGLVIDELSKMRKSGGRQFRALRRNLKHFDWRVGLTGTPVSENWLGLFAQALLLDSGAALGTNFDVFKRSYFFPTDYGEYNWELKPSGASRIFERVRDLIYDGGDYRNELPSLRLHTLEYQLSSEVRELYDEFRGVGVVEFGGVEVVADSGAVAAAKMAQMASGFVYDADGVGVRMCEGRLKLLADLLARLREPVVV